MMKKSELQFYYETAEQLPNFKKFTQPIVDALKKWALTLNCRGVMI